MPKNLKSGIDYLIGYLSSKYFENLDATDNSTNIATTKFVKDNPSTAKAWVNFNGTGTVAIRSSYNVSSVIDEGVGDYKINLINQMFDLNYSVVASNGDTVPNSQGMAGVNSAKITLNSFGVWTAISPHQNYDRSYINVLVFGN